MTKQISGTDVRAQVEGDLPPRPCDDGSGFDPAGSGPGAEFSGGGSAGNTAGGGVGNPLDGFEIDWPDPREWGAEMAEGIWVWLLESLSEGVASMVDQFNRSLLTLPASGESSEPATWLLEAVNDPFWQAVALVYLMLTGIALPIIWGLGLFNVAFPRDRSREERAWIVVKAVLLIAAGWFILMGYIHFWNEAILAFAPEGEEFLETSTDTGRLGIGVFVGALLLKLKAILVALGILLHVMFMILTYLLVAVWPLAVALHYSDVIALKPIGTASMVAALVLSPIYFVKALLLRLMYELPIDPASPETLLSVLLIMMGILIAFVGVPYFGLKNIVPHTVIGAGMKQAQAGRDSMGKIRERAPSKSELRNRVYSSGGTGGGGSGSGNGGMSQSNAPSGSALQSRSRHRPQRKTSESYETYSISWRGPGSGSDTRTRSRSSSRTR